MFRCDSYTIISERINSCLLKLQLNLPAKIHRCVVNTVVVWLHILYMQPHHHRINVNFNTVFKTTH